MKESSREKGSDDSSSSSTIGPSSPTGSALQAGAARIRETAKWLAATFGAVAAALITTLSLANLGKLSGRDLSLAMLGFALGLLGTVATIVAVARVLMVVMASLTEVSGPTANKKLVGRVMHHPALLAGFEDPDRLAELHLGAQRQRIDSFRHTLEPLDDDDRKYEEARFAQAEGELDLTDPIVDRVVDFMAFERLRSRFRWALVVMVAATSVAGVGIGMFAYFGNRTPSVAARTVLEPQPVAAMADLNETGRKNLGSLFGPRCDLHSIDVIALTSTPESVELVVAPGSPCTERHFTVTHEEGTVCSVESAIKSPPPLPPPSRRPGTPGIGTC